VPGPYRGLGGEDVRSEVFTDAAGLAHRVGVALEKTLRPARCYVAALGTDAEDLPMTSAHLHFNLVPVPEARARPKDVLTWSNGIYDGSPEEWRSLAASLRRALRGRTGYAWQDEPGTRGAHPLAPTPSRC